MNDLRNAIAHGLGNLTPRLARRDRSTLAADLATIDVVVTANRMVVSEEAVEACGNASREFVEWLALELQDYDLRDPLTP